MTAPNITGFPIETEYFQAARVKDNRVGDLITSFDDIPDLKEKVGTNETKIHVPAEYSLAGLGEVVIPDNIKFHFSPDPAAKFNLTGNTVLKFEGDPFLDPLDRNPRIKGATVTGRDSKGNGGTGNIRFTTDKFPKEIASSIIESDDISHQLVCLDRAFGETETVKIIGRSNAIRSRVCFSKKRIVEMERKGNFPNEWHGNAPFILDSDSEFDGGWADLHECATAGDAAHDPFTVMIGVQSWLRTSGGQYIYQERDVKIRNVRVVGNDNQGNYLQAKYNGTSAAINIGNSLRTVVDGVDIDFVHGYFIQVGLDGNATLDYHCEDAVIKNFRVAGGMAQMVAIGSARNFEIRDGDFVECVPYYPSNAGIFDIEANALSSIVKDFRIRNLKIFVAVPGQRNSRTGNPHPEQSDDGGNTRTFQGFHLKGADAAVCEGVSLQDSEVHGGGICDFGIYATELRNSYIERNKVYDCRAAYSYLRQCYDVTHKGNEFKGTSPSVGIVWSQSNRECEFEDKFTWQADVGGKNGNEKYHESEREISNVTLSAAGLLTMELGADKALHKRMVGGGFVITKIGGAATGNSTVYSITSFISQLQVQTNYSGSAIAGNATIEWRFSSNKYKSDSLAKVLATGSVSKILSTQEITPGLPKGTNVASAFVVTASSIEGGEGNAGRAPSHVNDGIINPNIGMWASSAAPSVEAPQTLTFTAQSPQEIKLIRVWGSGDGYPANPKSTDVANNQRIKNYSIWALINNVLTEVATVTNNTLVTSESSVNLYTTKLEFRFTEVAGGPVRVTEIQLFDKAGTY